MLPCVFHNTCNGAITHLEDEFLVCAARHHHERPENGRSSLDMMYQVLLKVLNKSSDVIKPCENARGIGDFSAVGGLASLCRG